MRIHALIPILALASTLLSARGAAEPPETPNTVAIESRVENWPEGATFVESKKGLPLDPSTPAFPSGPGMSTGYRILNLIVLPGETVKFKLKAEDQKVSMRVHVPDPPPVFEWRVALNQANKPYLGGSRPRMEVKNNTQEPQNLGLIIFGRHAYSYRVDLERIPAGK